MKTVSIILLLFLLACHDGKQVYLDNAKYFSYLEANLVRDLAYIKRDSLININDCDWVCDSIVTKKDTVFVHCHFENKNNERVKKISQYTINSGVTGQRCLKALVYIKGYKEIYRLLYFSNNPEYFFLDLCNTSNNFAMERQVIKNIMSERRNKNTLWLQRYYEDSFRNYPYIPLSIGD